MQVKILGALEATRDDGTVVDCAPRQKSLLALLLIAGGRPVSLDRIIEELWGESPPDSVNSAVGFHVSRLRQALEPGVTADDSVVFTRSPGYGISLDRIDVDSVEFEQLLATASPMVESQPDRAATLLTQALALWRGPALHDFAYEGFAQSEIARLEELKLAAIEARIDAGLAAGRHVALVGELEKLVLDYPLREGIWGRLMKALYRSGRQGEALRAFGRVKELLGEELGIDPSAELVALEEQMLLQDPSLEFRQQSPNNLPSDITPFVGRVAELERLTGLVAEHRFVSVKGLGGVGKTRLAVESARRLSAEYEGGVWFIDLAGVVSGESLVGELNLVLGLPEVSGASELDSIAAALGQKPVLLLLDNCEQIRSDVSSFVERLLRACPAVTVVTTTRERIGGPSEYLFELGGLGTPAEAYTDPDALLATEAGALIAARASAVRHGVLAEPENADHLGAICRDLDGLPLALELAAARMRMMSPAEVRERLDDRFPLLVDPKRPGSPRHRTLANALEWSYELLNPIQAAVFSALAVFVGGWTLDAAIHVAGVEEAHVGEHLEALIDASLVSVVPGETATRYRMLETVRQFAHSAADRGVTKAARLRHLEYYVGLASSSRAEFVSAGQAAALERLQLESANLHAALATARENDDKAAELSLVANLGRFWFDAGFLSEGLEQLRTTLDSAEDEPTTELAKALEEVIQLYAWDGSIDLAKQFANRHAQIVEAIGTDEARSRSVGTKGVLAFVEGDYREAIDRFTEMLSMIEPAAGESVLFLYADLAYLSLWTGAPERAVANFDLLLRSVDELGLREGHAIKHDFSGWRHFYEGAHESAIEDWAKAESVYVELEQRTWVIDMQQLQSWARLIGGVVDGAELLQATEEASRLGLRPFVARGTMLQAVEADSGEQLRNALRLAHSAGSRVATYWSLWYGVHRAVGAGELANAKALYRWAERFRCSIPLALPAALSQQDEGLRETLGNLRAARSAIQDFDISELSALIPD